MPSPGHSYSHTVAHTHSTAWASAPKCRGTWGKVLPSAAALGGKCPHVLRTWEQVPQSAAARGGTCPQEPQHLGASSSSAMAFAGKGPQVPPSTAALKGKCRGIAPLGGKCCSTATTAREANMVCSFACQWLCNGSQNARGC
jgi:hypothetical protein